MNKQMNQLLKDLKFIIDNLENNTFYRGGKKDLRNIIIGIKIGSPMLLTGIEELLEYDGEDEINCILNQIWSLVESDHE